MAAQDEPSDAVPMLAYENGVAALEWLSEAFGFVERARIVDDDGVLGHGELATGNGVIMLATPTPDYQSPKTHREHCAAARRWSQVPYIITGVMVRVDDVDAHAQRARAAGATLLSEPTDTPYGRMYRAEDIEGHRWMFVQRP